MSIKVSVNLITLPAGAMKVVAGHAQKLSYRVTPAPTCELNTPGAVSVPLAGPQAPPGTTRLAGA